jgi:hypothetical protein
LRDGRSSFSIGEPPFLALAAILLAVFAVTRIPFFWYGPGVSFSQDSGGYLHLVDLMRAGKWPPFVIRTPGYPVLVWMVTSVVDRWAALILVQNLLSLASALGAAYSVQRLRRPLALPATLAMCGYLGSSQVLFYDISILSDSLYTSLAILSFAFLVLAYAEDGARAFLMASAAMAMAVLVRPAGAYFMVIYAVVLGQLLWTGRRRRAVLGFLLPFPVLILGLCAYNLATTGKFIFTAFGESNLAGATGLFWEPDPRLPPEANAALRGLPDSLRELGITDDDLRMMRTSWDSARLFELYSRAYNRLVWSGGWGTGSRFGPGGYLVNRAYIRAASMIAIRRHPELYAKFVWVNLGEFYGGIGYKFDLASSLSYRAAGPASSQDVARSLVGPGEMPSGPAPAPANVASAAPFGQGLERFLKGLALGWQSFHGFIFQRVAWSWAFFALSIASLVQLARHAGRHLGAFLLFVLTLIHLGAGLVVCLSQIAMDRYSYPTQFACYLAVALSPLLFWPGKAAS